MRVPFLSQFHPPVIGGEERHVRNRGAALAQRGHHVSVGTELDSAIRMHRLRDTLLRLAQQGSGQPSCR